MSFEPWAQSFFSVQAADSNAQACSKQLSVPVNFGLDLLSADAFNDLTLIVGGELTLKANSAIIALNSPVARRLIDEGGVPPMLELSEFSEDAVRAFLTCCYTDDSTEQLTRKRFRELNKIATALEVPWLRHACLEFYEAVCSDLKDDIDHSGDDALFLFWETGYFLVEAKDKKFMSLLKGRLRRCRNLRKVLLTDLIWEKLKACSKIYFELCATLAGSDIPAVYKKLMDTLMERKKDGQVFLARNERGLLIPSCLATCKTEDKEVFENLWDSLSDLDDPSSLQWLCKSFLSAEKLCGGRYIMF